MSCENGHLGVEPHGQAWQGRVSPTTAMGIIFLYYDRHTLISFTGPVANVIPKLPEIRINLIKIIRVSNVAPDATARRSIDQLSRHVRVLGKFFRRLQQLNVVRFVELPMCSNVVLYYWDKVVEATNAPREMISGTLPELEQQ
jgi:hypothetical protein